MKDQDMTNSFIEVEVIDEKFTEEKQIEIEAKKREYLDKREIEDGLSPEAKRALGIDYDNDDLPDGHFEVQILDEDLEEFRYKKYIRKDLRVVITDRGEKDIRFLDIDGEIMQVSDSVKDLLIKFAQ